MKQSEYRHLLAERKELQRMLDQTPAASVISRHSLAKRLRVVQMSIDAAVVDPREPAVLRLTFRGQPVIGTRGIFAEFGAKAVGVFNEVIAAMAAAAEAPLADKGPIPKREQNQLLITATAQGSFGFVLEEHYLGQLRLDEETPTLRAIRQTHAVLRGMLGTDDDLADAAAELAPRALDRLRDFLKTLVDAQAYCAADLGGQEARFTSVEQVSQSLDRLRQDNFMEVERDLQGAFNGVLKTFRLAEFEVADSKAVLKARIAAGVPDIEKWNERIGWPATIRVRETTVGKGRPRHVIIRAPEFSLIGPLPV